MFYEFYDTYFIESINCIDYYYKDTGEWVSTPNGDLGLEHSGKFLASGFRINLASLFHEPNLTTSNIVW